MSDSILVVRAEDSSVDALVATLVDSHLDYEWELWAVQGDDRTRRLAAAYRSDLVEFGLPHGVVEMTEDAASLAVWIPAGADELLDLRRSELQERGAAELFRERAAVVSEVDELVAAASCPPADWYLATMGTRPDRQRQGLGSAALAPMLARLDASGESARLETSTADNVRFYERHGFGAVAELDLPHGAPTTWVMHRPPR